MSKGLKYVLRNALGLKPDMSFGFYFTDIWYRKILRQNADVKWAIHHTSTIRCAKKLIVGKNVFPGDSPGVYINANNGVFIGDFSNIGPNVGIISANHDSVNNDMQTIAPPINIGNFCWFGMGAIVMPGVCLGDFTTVGAGAIVTKSFEEGYCVIAGNPAKIIKQLDRAACDAQASAKYAAYAAR